MNFKYLYKFVVIFSVVFFTISCSHLNSKHKVNRDVASSLTQNKSKSATGTVYIESLIPNVGSEADTDEAFEYFKQALDEGLKPNTPIKCKKNESGHELCTSLNFTARACYALNSRYLDELIKRDVDNLRGRQSGGLNSHVYDVCLHRAFNALHRAEFIVKFLKKYADRGLLDFRFADKGFLKLKGNKESFSVEGWDGSAPRLVGSWLTAEKYIVAKFLSEIGVDINYYATSGSTSKSFSSFKENSASLLQKYIKLGFDVKFNGAYRPDNKSKREYLLIGLLERPKYFSSNHLKNAKYKNHIDSLKIVIGELGKLDELRYPYNTNLVIAYALENSSRVSHEQRKELIKLLSDNGAELGPDLITRFINNIDIVELLIDFGADVNVIDRLYPPLHAAAQSNRLDVVKLLVESGADIKIELKYDEIKGQSPTAKGLTAEEFAKKLGKTEVYKYLKEQRLKNSKVRNFLKKFK